VSSELFRKARGSPRPVRPVSEPPEVPHGGSPPPRRASYVSPPVIDLSASLNPYGPPPFLGSVLSRARAEVVHYPDMQQSDLRALLAAEIGVTPEEVLPAGSASELLRAVIAAFGSGRRVVVPMFTYEEYARCAWGVGARVVRVPMPGLEAPPASIRPVVRKGDVVIVPNPASPTGQYYPPPEWSPLVERCAETRSLLVVDESYRPFVEGSVSLSAGNPCLATVFSWSKVLATPGLPFGHMVADPEVVRSVRAYRLPWNVGPLSRHLAIAAVREAGWVSRTLRRVHRTAWQVRREIGSASQTHYFVVEAPSARRLKEGLRKDGFLVRDLSSMGLPRHIRFAVRKLAETEQFLEHLRRRALVPGIPGERLPRVGRAS
jgi:histidinol-phosphate/aromatic aminotransferase/cobyric acid decarboxylase-like protein